jgi:hypothetical protein
MAELTLLINNTTNDTEVVNIGTDWIAVDPTLDWFIFTAGGAGVANGSAIPDETSLNRCATQLSSVDPVIVSKYFLADYSANLLKEVKMAGNQNKRYVFACSFDGATATEPQLEAWDNSGMDTYASPALGSGLATASWFKGICTTLALPGTNWTGTALAGSGVSNIVLLNNGSGALTVADILYFNFKIIIPAGYLTPGLTTPILAVVYTTN